MNSLPTTIAELDSYVDARITDNFHDGLKTHVRSMIGDASRRNRAAIEGLELKIDGLERQQASDHQEHSEVAFSRKFSKCYYSIERQFLRVAPLVLYMCADAYIPNAREREVEARVAQLEQRAAQVQVVETHSYAWLDKEFKKSCKDSGDPICKVPNLSAISEYAKAQYLHRGWEIKPTWQRRVGGVRMQDGRIAEVYGGERVQGLRAELANMVRVYLPEK